MRSSPDASITRCQYHPDVGVSADTPCPLALRAYWDIVIRLGIALRDMPKEDL